MALASVGVVCSLDFLRVPTPEDDVKVLCDYLGLRLHENCNFTDFSEPAIVGYYLGLDESQSFVQFGDGVNSHAVFVSDVLPFQKGFAVRMVITGWGDLNKDLTEYRLNHLNEVYYRYEEVHRKY